MDERLVNLETFEPNGKLMVVASKLRSYGIFSDVEPLTGALRQWRTIQMGCIPVKVRGSDYRTATAT